MEQLKETTRFCSKIEWSTREKITHIRFPSPNLLTGFLYFFSVSVLTQDIHIHLNCVQSSFMYGKPKSHSFIHMQISFLRLIFEWKFYWCKSFCLKTGKMNWQGHYRKIRSTIWWRCIWISLFCLKFVLAPSMIQSSPQHMSRGVEHYMTKRYSIL